MHNHRTHMEENECVGCGGSISNQTPNEEEMLRKFSMQNLHKLMLLNILLKSNCDLSFLARSLQ